RAPRPPPPRGARGRGGARVRAGAARPPRSGSLIAPGAGGAAGAREAAAARAGASCLYGRCVRTVLEVTTIPIMPRRLLALAIGLVVLVFGGSAAVCATMPSWPSPAMFVLATVALPFLALGALLVAGAPVGFPLLLVWLFDRALCAW